MLSAYLCECRESERQSAEAARNSAAIIQASQTQSKRRLAPDGWNIVFSASETLIACEI